MTLDTRCLMLDVQYQVSSIQYRDTLDKSADQYYSISGLTGSEKGFALAKASYRELQDYTCKKANLIN